MTSTYFEKSGRDNTLNSLKLAYSAAKKWDVRTIVVSSTSGTSALEATNVFNQKSLNLIIVTHHDGFRHVGNEFPPEIKENILRKLPSAIFHTGSHALSGVERSFRRSHDTLLPVEMIAITLRKCFGEGTKVCMEMAIMVSDAGLVKPEGEIICIAGTGKGLDTAWLVKLPIQIRYLI
ncbi:MAG: pyruvate kinase alpha/beta domain-containing protein [Candidatus Hodarchaeales archaeon]|jgi:hypothetical protein